MKWVLHLCQLAPGSVEAIASTSPACASEITKRTPERPRATSPRRNAVHPAPSSVVMSSTPKISQLPWAFTPVAMTHANVHDPPALTDLLGEGVEPHVGVGTSVQRAGTEVLDLMVEAGDHRDCRRGVTQRSLGPRLMTLAHGTLKAKLISVSRHQCCHRLIS